MSSATPVKAASIKTVPEMRVLKIASCSSASGRSKLTYHVGCTPEGEILFRVMGNSRAGFYSKEWVSLHSILQSFDTFGKKFNDKELTSFVLAPIFKGKSTNTPAFLFAALKAEGVIRPSTVTRRCFERGDLGAFTAKVKALIKAPAKKTPAKQAPAKKVAAKPASAVPVKKASAKPAKKAVKKT